MSSYPKDPAYGKAPNDPAYPPGHYGAPPGYPSAPPPYSHTLVGQNPVPMYAQQQQYTYAAAQAPAAAYPPGQPMMHGGPGPAPPAYGYQPQVANPGYPVQPGFSAYPGYQVAAMAQFDSGARFDGISSQNIPPPPPGCAPNAAQMTASQGGQVFATQKKDNWFTGGKGGGVSFW
ncbi:DAZ-associated protein 2 [Aplysia californica]|uniref:DAZ-associated protein 2 n=1 Tax=Aplysia californica TaxID=6500 RepID=A0ABM0JYP5_APLCA|nr:DAZ-associated protein 2 [Aplysia californica]